MELPIGCHDHLRYGLQSKAQDARSGHQVASCTNKASEFAIKTDTAAKIYGTAFAMRLKTEAAAASGVQRLPGLPSSMVGLETLLGKDQDLEFEDVLDMPADRPAMPKFTVHDAMEMKFGLL